MATYYMRADGVAANKAAATSDAAAATSLSIAGHNAETFSAGDVIRMSDAGGTYLATLEMVSSGTSGSPITYLGKGTPIIDGQDSLANCIHGGADAWVVIDGITCSNFTTRGLHFTNADGIVIQNCTIDGGNDAAPTFGIHVQETTAALRTGHQILNNTINTIKTTENDTVNFAGINVNGGNGCVISGNTINTTNTVGLWLLGASGADGTNNIIENNDIYGCYGGVVIANQDSLTIRYNTIRDGKGLGIGLGFDSDSPQIYYNKIYNLTEKTTSLWNGIDINNDSIDGTIYNNTIYNVSGNCVVLDDAIGTCTGYLIKNNIFDSTINNNDAVPPLCFRVNGTAVTWTSDNNVCYSGRAVDLSEKFVNGSFETFTGTTDDGSTDTFTGWTNTTGTGGTVESVTVADAALASIPSGTYAIALKQASGGVQTLVSDNMTLKQAWTYTLTFNAQYNGSSNWRMALRGPAGTYLAADGSWPAVAKWDILTGSSATWEAVTLTFTTNAAGSYNTRFENLFNNGDCYFDNFSLVEVGPALFRDNAGAMFGFTDWQTNETQEANSVNSDPLFIDSASDDFSLQTGSPAINTGVDVSLTRDFAGATILGLPDMGALEGGFPTYSPIYTQTITGLTGVADGNYTTELSVLGVLTLTEAVAAAEGGSATPVFKRMRVQRYYDEELIWEYEFEDPI